MNFHITVGRGTENFAETEIKEKLCQLDNIQVRDGKILFQTSDSSKCLLNAILDLKCIERAFITIADYENKAEGKRDFLNNLMGTFSSTANYDLVKLVLNQLAAVLCKNKLSKTESMVRACCCEPVSKKIKLQDCDVIQHSDVVENSKAREQETMDNGSTRKNTLEEGGFKSFRMSVRCSGKPRRWIDVKRLSRDVSWRISQASGWKVELKDPDLEICLHINDYYVTAGIPLSKEPLSRRSFIWNPGLRSPVAWIMTQLAQIKAGDVLLDPMCGKGTLLLEAASVSPQDAYFLGADIDESQLQAAKQNITKTKFGLHIGLFHANSLYLPLSPMSVDKVICDAPFNQNHLVSDVDEFYMAFFQEMWRVLKISGRFVLLTSQEISKKIIPCLEMETPTQTSCKEESFPPSDSSQSDQQHTGDSAAQLPKLPFHYVSKHYVKLGETHGEIIVMSKLFCKDKK